MRNILHFSITSFALVTFLAGCGGAPDDLPDLVPVSGKVMLDGKALADAQVQFEFQGKGGGLSSGQTDSEGKYTLKFGSGEYSGAKPGKHIVRVISQKTKTDAEGNDVQTEEKVPEKYNWNSELTADVTADKADGYDFDLKSE